MLYMCLGLGHAIADNNWKDLPAIEKAREAGVSDYAINRLFGSGHAQQLERLLEQTRHAPA